MNLNECKTPDIILAEIIMQRQVFKGSFLLVEGVDDRKFWSVYTVKDECELVDCGGKNNLVPAIEKIDKKKLLGVLGIADDDFDYLENTRVQSKNLLYTEQHDLECLLFQANSLEKILAEYGELKRIKQFESTHGCTVQDALLAYGLIWGRLRWLCKRNHKAIKFERFKPANYFDETTWQLDKDELYKNFIAQYQADLTLAELETELAKLPTADPWNICQGHDLISILVIGLKQVLGSNKKIGVDHIAAILRQGFEVETLCNTQLANDIIKWENNNTPYQILRCCKANDNNTPS